MSHKHDYVVVGRWRNRDMVKQTASALRKNGKKVYCFVDHQYDGDGIQFNDGAAADVDAMTALEELTDWQTNPTFRKIFEADMQGVQDAESLVLVFPAGLSAHMELGVAYGMGKKCYGVGAPEKPETLYLMFDRIFPTLAAMAQELA